MQPGYPEVIEELIGELKQLPGVGRKAAERMALALLKRQPGELQSFGALISGLPESVGRCPECGALSDRGGVCRICSAPGRDPSLLCVVENMPQLFALEASGHYRGYYLVLGGKLNPLESENGSSLNVELLKSRAARPEVREVILALSSDVEGRATAAFLAEILQALPVRITHPALGLPAGANLSFADAATIAAALGGRSEF